MTLAVVLLALLCAALIIGFRSLEGDLRRAKGQLLELQRGETRVRLDLDSPNQAAEDLFSTLNDLLEDAEARQADCRRRERELRRQIANLSHDLRTPLTSILGYLQLLEDPALGEGERREYLEIIALRAQALRELITAFYDLSRIEGGDYPLEREPVDLRRELSETLAQFYPELEGAGFTVSAALGEGLPPVWGDRGAVRRIFSNLMANALRHGEGELEIRLERRGDRLATAFTNPAPGMSQEDLACVFERSFTADRARAGQDSGLGLSIVQALAERMGHQAQAALQEGRFTLEILWEPLRGPRPARN